MALIFFPYAFALRYSCPAVPLLEVDAMRFPLVC